MTYCVMEDLIGATEVKIHRQSCGHFVNHGITVTTKWHRFNDLEAARRKAKEISKRYSKGWREAKCCMK